MVIEYFLEDKENEANSFYVEFSGDIKWENDGIGLYEYWGAKCFDKGNDYPVMWDSPKWDETKHSESENLKIKEFLEDIDNEDIICNLIEKEAMKYENRRNNY